MVFPPRMRTGALSKFFLYEKAVQNPKWQVGYLPQFHRWLSGREPRSFREDFCGSGKIACEWAKTSPDHTSLGLDIDPEALAYARQVNRASLGRNARERVNFLRQDVRKPTRARFDWIGAFNFSFYVFHRREDLLKYARSALRSLNPKGTLFLELAGGPGFVQQGFERKSLRMPGGLKVTQIWETHPYDPITAIGDYSIHFQLPNRRWLNDAFTYHWRIWGVREVREILRDAGFRKSIVLWQTRDPQGRPSGEFLPLEEGEPQDSWVAYVVGCR